MSLCPLARSTNRVHPIQSGHQSHPFNLFTHPPQHQAHGDSLLSRDVGGCAWLLTQRKHDDLGLMFRLFRREGMVLAAAAAEGEGGEGQEEVGA